VVEEKATATSAAPTRAAAETKRADPMGSARHKKFGATSTASTNANRHATTDGGGDAGDVSSPHPQAWPSRH
jgi:hypothetical protein